MDNGVVEDQATVVHEHVHRNPDHESHAVKLIRNTKGYGWEISVKGSNIGAILNEVDRIDTELTEKFGSQS